MGTLTKTRFLMTRHVSVVSYIRKVRQLMRQAVFEALAVFHQSLVSGCISSFIFTVTMRSTSPHSRDSEIS